MTTKSTLLDKRNLILQSLRDQFRTKVHSISLKIGSDELNDCYVSHEQHEAFLLDLANNIAQGLVDEDESDEKLAEDRAIVKEHIIQLIRSGVPESKMTPIERDLVRKVKLEMGHVGGMR
jgi:hypothetical protein